VTNWQVARCKPLSCHEAGAYGRTNADSALVSAGAEMKWLSGFSLAATFEGELSSNVTSYAGKGVAKYTW
jgi:hypothetical protein